jgi:four helix bundle suffix protein
MAKPPDHSNPSGGSGGLSQPDGSERTRGKRLRPAGGYRSTASFQTATLIYDATYWFCEKFLDQRSRTVDQMVQAARSGRQNIAEGSRAAATSSKSELHLLNVARSSLEELLLDYEDYLRHRRLPQWKVDSAEAMAVREVARKHRDCPGLTQLTDQERGALYAPWLENSNAAVRADAILCLIHQANYLLDQQLVALEQAFITDGGYSEQLATARLAERERNRRERLDRADPSDSIPRCPQCGKAMALRTARAGKNAGSQFWGCTGYPECKGVAQV